MFTFGAMLFGAVLMWLAIRANEQDRPAYDEDRIWILVLHIRQDLKLVVFLLAGVLVMLGVIADRLH
jgi:hypothetical protein